jgi:hypothetical protein
MSITSYSSSKLGPSAVVGAQQKALDIKKAFNGGIGRRDKALRQIA